MDPKESGAGVDMLDRINASSMFASKTKLDPWIYKLTSGQTQEIEVKIEEELSTRECIKKQKQGKEDILPIVIVDTEGRKRPFHFHDTISPGEKIIYLR